MDNLKTSDTLLVGFDFSNTNGKTVLIVGRKRPNHYVDIINAFEGQEALDLYEKLVTDKTGVTKKGE